MKWFQTFVGLVLFVLIASQIVIAQSSNNMEQQEQAAIDQVTKRLYQSITFREGEQPDLALLKSLFLSPGQLINNNGEQPAVFNTDDFIKTFQAQIEEGQLPAFEETESSSETRIYGTIAHRESTYQASFPADSNRAPEVGINSIQFVKVGDRWQISSIVWCASN